MPNFAQKKKLLQRGDDKFWFEKESSKVKTPKKIRAPCSDLLLDLAVC